MKYFIIALVVSLSFASRGHGQSYHPLLGNNKFWVQFHGDGTYLCGASGADQYFINGDTLISNINYKVFYRHPVLGTLPNALCPPFAIDTVTFGPVAFLREDTVLKRVYYYNKTDNIDDLLYDFALVLGDTVSTSCPTFETVDSVSTITLLNGQTRKILYYSNGINLIEGIGGSSGLFSCPWSLISTFEEYVCVLDNGVQIYKKQPPAFQTGCIGTVGLEHLSDAANEMTFDQENLCLEVGQHSNNGKLCIYSTKGTLCYQSTLNYGNNKLVVNFLVPGLYFAVVENEMNRRTMRISIVN